MPPKDVPSFGLEDTTGTKSQGDRSSNFPSAAGLSGEPVGAAVAGGSGSCGPTAVEGIPGSIHASATRRMTRGRIIEEGLSTHLPWLTCRSDDTVPQCIRRIDLLSLGHRESDRHMSET